MKRSLSFLLAAILLQLGGLRGLAAEPDAATTAQENEPAHQAETLAKWIRDAKEGQPAPRARAMMALAKLGPEAVPALGELLKDKDAIIRRGAAEILWAIGPNDKTATAILVELLENREDQFRPAPGEIARMTAFLAEEKGKPAADFPAWIDYRKIAGDTPVSRRLFGDMLRAEPELCAGVGGDPKRLGELLDESVTRLTDDDAIRRGRYRAGLGDVAAVLFVAARPDVTPFFHDDPKIFHAVDTALRYGPSVRERLLPLLMRGARVPGMGAPDPRMDVVKTLASRWVLQEGDPKWTVIRLNMAERFGLEEAKASLTLQWLRRPCTVPAGHADVSPLSAILTVRKLGKKEYSPLLAKYLEWNYALGYPWSCPGKPGVDPQLLHVTVPQLRDLALSVIVEVSGKTPEKYGFLECRPGTKFDPTVYLFPTIEQRNQGFALAIKNYKELGLERPPKYTPEAPPRFFYVAWTSITSSRGVASRRHRGNPPGSLTSPDGKTRLDLQGNTARLVDVASGEPIGKELDAGMWNEGRDREFTFTCGAFSPDGKYVVTGSSFAKTFPPQEDTLPTNVGKVQVWDAATGAAMEMMDVRTHGPIGSVRAVRFDKDGKVINYDAERYSLDKS